MSSGSRPDGSPAFVRVSTVPRSFLVVGRVARVEMHYGYLCNGGRLCSGVTCSACREGLKPEIRHLVRLEEADRTHYLWEARPRLAALLAEVEAYQASGRTVELELWRARSAPNAPIEARILAVVAYPDLYDLERLVVSCYQPPIRIAEPPRLDPDRPRSPVVGIQDTAVSAGFSNEVGVRDSDLRPGLERLERLKRLREAKRDARE